MKENYFRAHQPKNLNILSQIKGMKYILFDLETTGFYAEESDQITQIGASVINGDTLETEGDPFVAKIKLNDFHYGRLRREVRKEEHPGYQSAHWILALNGYHPLTRFSGEKSIVRLKREDDSEYDFEYQVVVKMTEEELVQLEEEQKVLGSEEEVLNDFLDWVESKNAERAIGHNACVFDKKFLNTRLKLYGGRSFNKPVLDTMWIARLTFIPAVYTLSDMYVDEAWLIKKRLSRGKDNPENLSSKLQDLRDALKIEGGTAHDAYGDIITNLQVFKGMLLFLFKYKEKLDGSERFNNLKRQVFAKHKDRGFKY